MYQGKRIAIVVPAFNEQKNISKVIRTIPPFVDHVVVVDDASSDGTAAIVEEHTRQESRVLLIRHEQNQGVGGAIATGYKWARDNGADIAVVFAGDGQMDPANLTGILDPVVSGQADYSKANRLASGEAFRQIPKIRFFGNSILSLLTKVASGYWHVADSQTGYTAINKAALHAIDWDKMYKRYGQPNDLLVKLNVHGFRVKDVPQKPVYNVGEESKLKVHKVLLPISLLLVRSFFWRIKEKYIVRDFHPLVLFYFLGVSLFVVSVCLFVRMVYLWGKIGHVPEISALGWMMSFAVGLQSIFFAMWFDKEYNRSFRQDET